MIVFVYYLDVYLLERKLSCLLTVTIYEIQYRVGKSCLLYLLLLSQMLESLSVRYKSVTNLILKF